MTLEIFNIPRYWALTYIPERDWICSRIPIVPKAKWICFRERTYSNDIHSVLSSHCETVALLSKLDVDKHIDVEIKLDELDLTSAESKATYAQIKEYVLEKFGLKVSTLYIAQIKKKCGIEMREHYNKSKDNQAIPQCTPEKKKLSWML